MSTTPPRNDVPDPGEGQGQGHRPASSQSRLWPPSRRTLVLAGAAFAIGLLLFLLSWWRDRGNDFYRAEGTPQTAEGQQFEPLPAPSPAGAPGNSASGMDGPDNAGATPAPRIIATPAAPAPPPPPRPPEVPVANGLALAPGSTPVPVDSPAPAYPIEALRAGESGTALLRVHVGEDGVPFAVDLVESSHSRSLDRAASEAVKRWRFRPAQRDGHPVAGEVQIPIAFNADR